MVGLRDDSGGEVVGRKAMVTVIVRDGIVLLDDDGDSDGGNGV